MLRRAWRHCRRCWRQRRPMPSTEIQWWHAMSGELGRIVEQLASDFNASQADYRIVPEYKGQYTETMTAALFAIRTGRHPAIVQVNEVATATMMAAKGATYPVLSADARAGRGVRPGGLSAGGLGLLHRRERQHAVVSVQRLDADPLLQQGPVPPRRARSRDRRRAPGRRSRRRRRKLLAAGVPCGFTTAWPSWIHIENLSAVHDVPIATRQNGFGGLDTELTISNDDRGEARGGARRMAEEPHLRLWRPRGPRRREIPRQPVRHVRRPRRRRVRTSWRTPSSRSATG